MLALASPRLTLSIVGAVSAVAIALVAIVPDRFSVAGFTDGRSPSSRALDSMRHGLGYDPEPGMVVLARSRAGFHGRTLAAVEDLAAQAARDPAVGAVETAFGPRAFPPLLAAGGRETLLLVHFRSSDLDALRGPIARLRHELRPLVPLRLRFDGYAVGFLDINRIARSDLVRAELIAFPILALLMLLLFRGSWRPCSHCSWAGRSAGNGRRPAPAECVFGVSVFALNLAVLLGLGLAVDYSLLLVSRFARRSRGGALWAAVRRAVGTAGRTVVFSGLAVAGACAALLLFPQRFIFSMGIAGILVSLLAASAALLITPAVLMLFPRRVAGADRRTASGRWSRWASWVMRRHVDVALVTAALLVAAAAPALGLKLTFGDFAAVPRGVESRSVADTITRDFPPQLEYPVNVVIRTDRPGGPQDLAAERLLLTPRGRWVSCAALSGPGSGVVAARSGPAAPLGAQPEVVRVGPARTRHPARRRTDGRVHRPEGVDRP